MRLFVLTARHPALIGIFSVFQFFNKVFYKRNDCFRLLVGEPFYMYSTEKLLKFAGEKSQVTIGRFCQNRESLLV